MSSLPLFSSNYLAPFDLDVTLSVRSRSSINDDSSIMMNENMMQKSVASSPKRSGTHNLRREGYSEEKCRYVLVKYCSSIPRNFNYAEGVQLVYEKLREHCGDENLDLSIGVLYEFIEVDTEFTFDQGAAFRRWQFDHSHRAVDLTNNHAPRMGNIIVGNIIPTERLRQWRNQNPDRQQGVELSDSDNASPASQSPVETAPPHFGIVHRSTWHIENTLYVSSMRDGTRVQYCPSPQELHERAWNESYGRGGRLIRERQVFIPDANFPMEIEDPKEPKGDKHSKKKRIREIFVLTFIGGFSYILKIRLPRGCFKIPFLHINCIFGPHISKTVPAYEGLEEVMNLPDQDSEEGKVYYRNIKTVKLPDNVAIPNALFARKNDLMVYNEANEAQFPGPQNCMSSVEDLAIQKCLEANHEAATTGKRWTYRGPLTASLFKDSGIDYQWDVGEASGSGTSQRASGTSQRASGTSQRASGTSQRARNSTKLSVNTYLSEELSDDLAALRIPVSPARQQRARSLSKRALQGSEDIIKHDSVTWTVDDSDKDPSRPYAAWRPSGTQARLFSGNAGTSSSGAAVGVSSGSNFDRFAAQLQNRFNNPEPKPPRARGLERPREVGIRKRTAESVQARKDLLKKIVTFDGANDDVTVDTEEESPHAAAVCKENNNNIDNNRNNNSNNTENHLPLRANRRIQSATSFLRLPFIQKLSIALEHNISALASKVAECRMASPRRDPATEKIQVNGVFLLKSPVPLTIRKLSAETKVEESSQGSSSRQKQSTTLDPMREEPQELQQNAHDYPPRTSSHRKDEMTNLHHNHRRQKNRGSGTTHSGSSSRTHISDDSFMGNFIDVGAPLSTPPATSSNKRDKGPSYKVSAQDATARHRNAGPKPYEFETDPEVRHLTHMTTVHDFLSRKFEEDTATPPGRTVDRAPVSNRPAGHMKNSSFDANGNYMERREALNNNSTHALRRPDRAEYQQEEFAYGYGVHRVKSSPAIGVTRNPDPSPEIKSYAAYETYENDDRYAGPNLHTGSYHYSGSRENTASEASRGRQPRAMGLGIDSAELRENERGERDRVEVVNNPAEESSPSPKRSRSPMKKLFGPGGLLGNTGLPNSPADPRYVKQKSKHGMVSKIKTKMGEFAEMQRSISPIRNIFKAEEKVEEKTASPSKFPVSLSPPRQAKLYMELELLICATTNSFLMDQYKNDRMSPESMRKITEFWKNKGRPQVIEFQYDQATQRDLIVANQREFRFHGNNGTNALQVNAMLYSWKQNAREMAVRTFCTPDTIIQKQLHDTYRMMELLGAGMNSFMALSDIHKDFTKHVKRAQDARRKREVIKQLNGVEKRVALPGTPAEILMPSPPRGATKHMFPDTPVVESQEESSRRIAGLHTRMRSQSDISRAATADPMRPSRFKDPYYDAPIVKRGPYADQSAVLDDYYPPQVAHHYDNSSYLSRAPEQRRQYDQHDSSTLYSSRGSGSRNQQDPRDSDTSYSSASRVRAEERSAADSYYSQQSQPSHHGSSSSYSTQVAMARMQSEQRGSADSYSSRAPESRNNNSISRDEMDNRRRAVSPNRRAVRPAGRGPYRVTSDDSDDFSSFGKYGAGL